MLDNKKRALLSKMQGMSEEGRELMFDWLDILGGEETPESRRIDRVRNLVYDHMRDTRRKEYEESGIPISEDQADCLVRCHPTMPPPFARYQLDPKANFDRHPKHQLIVHSFKVIQEHLEDMVPDILRETIALAVLCSVEWFEKCRVKAETAPWCFDALNHAAIFATHPVAPRIFPNTDRLRRWKYKEGKGLITRPSRKKTGVDPLRDLARNNFFHEIVHDLRTCGLYIRRNPATGGRRDRPQTNRVYACEVVGKVVGLSPQTVWAGFNKARNL